MIYMFFACSSLSSDISKWNTNNVTNMKDIFANCTPLSTLSDISQWNNNNVTNMSWIFFSCSSIASISYILK